MKDQDLKQKIEAVIAEYEKVSYKKNATTSQHLSSLFNGHGPLGAERLEKMKREVANCNDLSQLSSAVIKVYLECFSTHPSKSRSSDFLYSVGQVLAKYLTISTDTITKLSPMKTSLSPPGESAASFSYDYKTGIYLAIQEKSLEMGIEISPREQGKCLLM